MEWVEDYITTHSEEEGAVVGVLAHALRDYLVEIFSNDDLSGENTLQRLQEPHKSTNFVKIMTILENFAYFSDVKCRMEVLKTLEKLQTTDEDIDITKENWWITIHHKHATPN